MGSVKLVGKERVDSAIRLALSLRKVEGVLFSAGREFVALLDCFTHRSGRNWPTYGFQRYPSFKSVHDTDGFEIIVDLNELSFFPGKLRKIIAHEVSVFTHGDDRNALLKRSKRW